MALTPKQKNFAAYMEGGKKAQTVPEEIQGYYSRPLFREAFFVSGAQRKSQKTRGQRREIACPALSGTAFLPFLCIAKRVTVRRTAFLSGAVNSNNPGDD